MGRAGADWAACPPAAARPTIPGFFPHRPLNGPLWRWPPRLLPPPGQGRGTGARWVGGGHRWDWDWDWDQDGDHTRHLGRPVQTLWGALCEASGVVLVLAGASGAQVSGSFGPAPRAPARSHLGSHGLKPDLGLGGGRRWSAEFQGQEA